MGVGSRRCDKAELPKSPSAVYGDGECSSGGAGGVFNHQARGPNKHMQLHVMQGLVGRRVGVVFGKGGCGGEGVERGRLSTRISW